MILRIRTTADVELKLTDLDKKLKLSSKAAIMRLAIACSLKMNGDPRIKADVVRHYDVKNQDGLDYQRLTVFGQKEEYYKVLITEFAQSEITDEEFFPELTYFHIERGVNYLNSEYRYLNDRDKFFNKLIELGDK